MGTHSAHRRPMLWFITAVVLALLATPLLAAELRTGEEVIIAANQVVDDNLYVAADSVRIDGVVNGDVVAAANLVTVNGTINGDLLAAAGTLIVNGHVADARVAGTAIQLGQRANVSGDLLAGGGSLELQYGSSIGADLLFGAGQVLLDGTVARDVLGGAGRMQVRGAVGGDMDVAVGGTDEPLAVGPVAPGSRISVPQVPPGLTVDNAAQIDGALRYRSSTAARIDPEAQIGDVIATIAPSSEPATAAQSPTGLLLGWLRHLATLVIIGLLLIWLVPTWTRQMAGLVEAAPLASLGWGLLAALGWVLAMILVLLAMVAMASLAGALTLGRLVALVIGLGLLVEGLLTAGLLIYVTFIAQAIVALLAGRLILARFAPAWNERPAVPLLLGLCLYLLLTALPLIGWLIGLAVALLGLGALWSWAWPRLYRGQPTAAPQAAAGVV